MVVWGPFWAPFDLKRVLILDYWHVDYRKIRKAESIYEKCNDT
jgi:hypothetical protein